ncbi:MAG: transcriptional regulator [Actinomyces urogenitalis]|uniref:transcriptional regulator n=1 Tax=Actinomyces urogenitalis TaxID=103621 RepID=UPI00243322D8|nr:transcriptional regulator [Actinomyces urogenitalis]MCI7455959.1 transcriptional regulator [Actinomyces urogenitalis]MDY3678111.1 transcriptional regulator [Actinomyces urogenitalis]
MLDPVIHPLPRLRICAALRRSGAIDGDLHPASGMQMRFAELRESLGMSDSALSKQLGALEQAGYLRRQRDYASIRSRDVVWVSLTQEGLSAFEAHLEALRTIAGQ